MRNSRKIGDQHAAAAHLAVASPPPFHVLPFYVASRLRAHPSSSSFLLEQFSPFGFDKLHLFCFFDNLWDRPFGTFRGRIAYTSFERSGSVEQ